MGDPGRSLGVNLFFCCVLVLCAALVFVVPVLGQLWQVVPELSTVEVAMRFQGLFLVMAAVCGMAAYCRCAGSSKLHALVGSCAACATVAVCLTAVLFAYKLLLLLQLLERDETKEVNLDNLGAVLLLSLLSVDLLALLVTLAATVCCVVYLSRAGKLRCCAPRREGSYPVEDSKYGAPGLPPRRPRGSADVPVLTAARYNTTDREPEYSLPRKAAYADEPVTQPRLVMAPDDAPVMHLARQPPGTVYVLPPGSLVMIEPR
ncbi:unnamed protein product [Ixodes hexagonus]